MSEPITPAISDRICQHMNQDHSSALVLYARVFGQVAAAETAQMVSLDSQGMDLSVTRGGETVPLRIPFGRPLKDAGDAHHTLIEMVREARKILA